MSTPNAGRRIAARRRTRPSSSAVAGLVLVASAGLLLVAGGQVEASTEPSPRPTSVPVDELTTACLGWPGKASAESSTLAAPLPSDDTEEQDAGGLTVGPVGEKPRKERAGTRGALRSLDAPGSGEALTVTATGAAAVGRATFQVDRGEAAGLATQECLQPRSRWWFTGGGAGLDHRSQLVMANIDTGPAVVDVVVQGPDGVAEDVGTRGVTIAPGEVRTIDLVEVAPQADELAVRVDTTRGRVVAGLADGFATQPAAEPGRDWLPGQEEAARLIRLAPLPRAADRRTLVLSNPADREALVEVRVSGESGSFVPTGLEQVRVPAQSVVTEDLGDAVGRDASAVVLRSPVPVTATVRSTRDGDASYAAAVPVLDGPAAALLEGDAEVQLSAAEGAASATVTAYSAGGDEVDSTALKLSSNGTAAWSPKGKAVYVVVTPERGLLSGGVSLAGGGGVSQLALRPLPVTLRMPYVEAEVYSTS